MKSAIDIFSTAGENSEKYLSLLRESMMKFSSGKFALNFKCIVNASSFDKIDGWKTVSKHKSVNEFPAFKASGSYIHGEMLNEIHNFVDTDFFIVSDADISVVSKDWDSSLMSVMHGNTAICGVESSVNDRRYMNFPCAIFMLCRSSDFLKIKPNFLPDVGKPPKRSLLFKKIQNKRDSKVWGKPISSNFNCDTGWRLPLSYFDRSLGSYCLRHEDNIGKKPLHPNFEAWYMKSEPMIIHAGGSRTINDNRLEMWTNYVRNKINA